MWHVATYTDECRVVVTNFREDENDMNLLNITGPFAAKWELFDTVNGIRLSGSQEVLQMKIYVKIGFPTKRPEVKNPEDFSFELLADQLTRGLNPHFLKHESKEFLQCGEHKIRSQLWEQRVHSFLLKYSKSNHNVGRVLENSNNCCYANSILALLCNIPLLRESFKKIQRVFFEDDDSNETIRMKSLMYILRTYSRSHDSEKSPFLLPFKKNKSFLQRKEDPYFECGLAMCDLLISNATGHYGCEDQAEWLHLVFFRYLEMIDVNISELFRITETVHRNTQCEYKSIHYTSTKEVFNIHLNNVDSSSRGKEKPKISVSQMLSDFLTKLTVETEFTSHFYPASVTDEGTVLSESDARLNTLIEKPVCAPCDVVYDNTTKQMATIVKKIDSVRVELMYHVSISNF
jgi:hypothetical protein